MSTARGGRKPKKAEEKGSRTIKTTVTESERERLQVDYQRETVGQQVSFAEYIRQRLSRSGPGKENGQNRNDGLAIQLALADVIAELHRVNELNSVGWQGGEGCKIVAEGEKNQVIPVQLATLTSRLEETIEQISLWLYGSSPEKI